MKKIVEEFLKSHGQSAENVDADLQMEKFIGQAQKGLRQNGCIIPMIPTYLCNVDRSKIAKGKRIIIDAGGTNFRSALGYFDDNGNVKIENIKKTVMPASNGEKLGKTEFYSRIAENISYLVEEGDAVGFCFSYPVDMQSTLDGKVVNFSKEVKAPEVVGTFVGKETLSALSKYSKKPRKIVILNDTVATLLGGMASSRKQYSTYLGYIYGTGTNVCCIVPCESITKVKNLPDGKMLVNMECGGYDGFELGQFDKAAIGRTDAPTKQLFEKMTSGRYLSEIIYEAVCVAVKEGLLYCADVPHFDLKTVSQFLDGEGILTTYFDGEEKEIVADICRGLIERAAKLGAIVNAATAVLTCEDKSLPVAIVAEGTTFNKLTGYRELFEKYLREFLSKHGITYEIVGGNDLNLVGTLMATMALN